MHLKKKRFQFFDYSVRHKKFLISRKGRKSGHNSRGLGIRLNMKSINPMNFPREVFMQDIITAKVGQGKFETEEV